MFGNMPWYYALFNDNIQDTIENKERIEDEPLFWKWIREEGKYTIYVPTPGVKSVSVSVEHEGRSLAVRGDVCLDGKVTKWSENLRLPIATSLTSINKITHKTNYGVTKIVVEFYSPQGIKIVNLDETSTHQKDE